MDGAFNVHNHTNFISGCVACLDESMSVLTNQFTCPGFLFAPQVTNPMVKEKQNSNIIT
jgi:hypothetical protein